MWLPDDPQALFFRGCTVVVLAVPEMHLFLLANLQFQAGRSVLAVLGAVSCSTWCFGSLLCLPWAQERESSGLQVSTRLPSEE